MKHLGWGLVMAGAGLEVLDSVSGGKVYGAGAPLEKLNAALPIRTSVLLVLVGAGLLLVG